jgi:protein-S-isoprenylcysteine O-methyltransferase Ste14
MLLAPEKLWQIEVLPWYAFLAVWAIAAVRTKTTKSSEPLLSRLTTGVLIAAAFVLLFRQDLPVQFLHARVLPLDAVTQWTGITLTFAGAAIAIWARFVLGANWSAKVTVKIGHELVRSGPYAYVRHPIYTGMLLAVIGTAVEIGEWRGVTAIILVAIAFWLKTRREEQFMTREFGDGYEQYRQNTGSLFPKI